LIKFQYHKFDRNPEENFAPNMLIFRILQNHDCGKTLTRKLLTGKLPTGIFSTNKVDNSCPG
jgi:hypothetical protein